ncbi:ESX-1 secretion-associated protein EspK-like [Equus przewalskii]|uniref:ESX-1 secretion-associated protein EspK-like n=1 Tax=Equus przewalskii TaxID=9798 RepID=A0ABM4KMH4_EQUPR
MLVVFVSSSSRLHRSPLTEPQEHNCVLPSPKLKPSCSLTLSKNFLLHPQNHPRRPADRGLAPAAESNSVLSSAQAAATQRKTSPQRPSPLPDLTNLPQTPCLAAPDTTVLGAPWPRGDGVGDVRVTFYSPVPLGRARHALPHSHGRQLERGPGPGAPNARRGTWGLQTPSARLRSSCSWPPPPPPPPSSRLVPSREPGATRVRVPGGLWDHLPGARAARRRAAAAGAAGGSASGPARGCAQLRAARLIVPGSAAAARAAGGTAAGSPGARRRVRAPERGCAAPHPRASRAPSARSGPLSLRHRLHTPRARPGLT